MQASSYLYDRLSDIGIAVPRAKPASFRQQPYGHPGSVNARPSAHGALVPPNVSAQNQTNQYGAIPNIYGKRQMFPPYAGVPFVEPTSGEIWNRALYLVGYGPVELSDFFLGNDRLNPVGLTGSTVGYDARLDVYVEVRYGTAGDTPMTLYPRVSEQDANSVTLSPGWSYKETPVACDEIQLLFTLPNGLYEDRANNSTDSSGQTVSTTTRVAKSVDLHVQYASCDSAGNLTSGWITPGVGGDIPLTGQTGSALTTSRRILVSRGLYIVRCERANPQSTDSNVADQVDWSALTAYVNEDPVPTLKNWDNTTIPLAKVAIRALSAGHRSQALDNFSCIVQRHLPVWNGTAFVTQATNSPSWALLDIYTGQINKRPIAPTRFDLANLLAFDASCASLGFEYNDCLDTPQTAYQVAQAIATAGRASFVQRNGLYGVFQDVPNSTIDQHFTPRNTSNFKFSKVWPKLPDSLRVQFVNPDIGDQQDEVIVYADGFSADGANGTQVARSFQTYQLSGVTSAIQAQKLGRYYLAVGALRPRTITFNSDFEHLLINFGSRIAVVHDVLLVGAGEGYIKSLTTNGSGDIVSMVIDEQLTYDGQSQYSTSIRLSDNSTLLADIVNTGNQTNVITFKTPVSHTLSVLPVVGNLLTVGIGPPADFLVTKVEPQTSPHMSAVITAVDYSPNVFKADSESYGVFVSSIQLPVGLQSVDVAPPIVLATQSDGSVSIPGPGGVTQRRIVITFQPGNDARVTTVQAQYRITDSGANYTQVASAAVQSGQISIGPVQELLTYDIQIRSVTSAGLASEWVNANHSVGTDTSIPPDITSADVNNGLLTWVAPALPADFAGYAVRSVASNTVNWAQGVPVAVGLLKVTQLDVSTFPAGPRVFMVKMIDTSGNESVNPASVALDVGDPLTANVVLSTDYKAASFPGVITGAAIDGSGFLTASSLGLMWGDDDSSKFWNPSGATLMWANPNATLVYECQYTVLSTDLPGNIIINETHVGDGMTIEWCVQTTDLPFWVSGGDSGLFWDPSSGTPFWSDGAFDNFKPFSGSLPAVAGVYKFRFTIPGGQQQGSFHALAIALDVPDLSELFNGQAIAATTGTRMPVTKKFRAILNVHITRQISGTGVQSGWVDKATTIGAGPLVKIIDASGNAVAGTVDVTCQGY